MKLTLGILFLACAVVAAFLPGIPRATAQAQAPGAIPMPVAPTPLPGNSDYVVAQGASVSELITSVKGLQAKGYACQGGIGTAISANGSGSLYQAMVR